MDWDKNNIDEIVGFINRELGTGRPMNNIEPVSYTHLDVYKRQI